MFLAVLAVVAVTAFTGLVALGNWQVERRAWKRDLVERVERRVHAAPVAAPGRGEWSLVTAARDEYRRVRTAGIFLDEHTALAQAATALGAGHWVLTPLRLADGGGVVFVNRGFVALPQPGTPRRVAAAPAGQVVVTGLLRMTEPAGGFLRSNDPAADRWHSRDVRAIAAVRGLADVAPFFIDAEAGPGGSGGSGEDGVPVAGLTVTSFTDNHLVYALTWYALALMVALAAGHVARVELRLRRARSAAGAPAARRAVGPAG